MRIILGLALFLLVGIAGAKTLATVDGVDITEKDFDFFRRQVPNFNFNSLSEAQQKQLVDEAISQQVIFKQAEKDKLERTSEYKELFDTFKKQALVTIWVKRQQQELEKNTKVSDAEVKEYYDNNEKFFTEEKGHVKHILVKTEDEAKKIIDELNKTPKSRVDSKFSSLAKAQSIDDTKASGGDLGEIDKNKMVPEFGEAAFALKNGTFSKTPVRTQFGYHVIYMVKKEKPIKRELSSVKDQIRSALSKQKLQNALHNKVLELRQKAKISFPK